MFGAGGEWIVWSMKQIFEDTMVLIALPVSYVRKSSTNLNHRDKFSLLQLNRNKPKLTIIHQQWLSKNA